MKLLVGILPNSWDDICFGTKYKAVLFGVTKYIWDIPFKIQSELTFDTFSYFNGSTKNNFMFVLEIG
jgi:hypothetical protein